jgi:hypothetical protein
MNASSRQPYLGTGGGDDVHDIRDCFDLIVDCASKKVRYQSFVYHLHRYIRFFPAFVPKYFAKPISLNHLPETP